MKKIGFFGGSFDPIHFGHIHLAIEMLEKENLDEILFCPALCSPFKTKTPPRASGAHRLAMLQLALADISHFRITTLELERKGPSYTIDTLRLLEGEGTLRLILTDDVIARFNHWKKAQEILRLAPPLIGQKMFAISSTQVRTRVEEKLYCGHLVPAKTLDYIHTHHLYCSN